jgi:inner membrane protein
MPLPVAHGLLGAGVAATLHQSYGARSSKPLLIGALLGICPDFDYALNWLRISGGGWHHGFTHSFLFAFFLGLVVSLVLRERQSRSVITYCAATLSHTLLDFLITGSRGLALWWPFTDHRYKLGLFNPIDYTWRSGSLSDATVDLLMISLTELIIFAPMLMAVLFIKRLLARRRCTD